VLEPLRGYLTLAERLYVEGVRWSGGWNFGPREEDARPVSVLADLAVENWGAGSWKPADEAAQPYEAARLMLDCSKADSILGWSPSMNLEQAVALAVDWYRTVLTGPATDPIRLTTDQIQQFEEIDGNTTSALRNNCEYPR
jgi:CDP-glucose 4,6-dehydratase